MTRRDLLYRGLSFAAAVPVPSASDADWQELTLSQFALHMRTGSLQALEVTRFYLRRIAALNQHGPALRAVIEINTQAEAVAHALDLEYRAKGSRGPLHGVPVLLKDNIDTGDRMQTTAGSLALLGAPAARDAFLVTRLRAAGAVILGKTNLSEWANWRSTHSTSGWSARGGQTRNPYALDRNPCGSSSGSAVAVSANLCMLAVGTETDGSVVCPASMNGIVGMKPTVGSISRSGIIPIGASQDTAGPMARNVTDAALLFAALFGVDPQDRRTTASKTVSELIFKRPLRREALRGARLGVLRSYFTMVPQVNAVMEEGLKLMASKGAVLVDSLSLPQQDEWRESETLVLQCEFKDGLNRYLSARTGTSVKTLADCIRFNSQHRALEMPFFEQELMEQSEETDGVTGSEYRKALEQNHRLAADQGIDAILREHQLHALLAPTAPPAFMTDHVNGDRVDSGCASPPAVAGYPHITVPAGFVSGLPVGLSFIGPAWTEPRLFELAYAFEQACRARQRPQFRPTALA